MILLPTLTIRCSASDTGIIYENYTGTIFVHTNKFAFVPQACRNHVSSSNLYSQ